MEEQPKAHRRRRSHRRQGQSESTAADSRTDTPIAGMGEVTAETEADPSPITVVFFPARVREAVPRRPLRDAVVYFEPDVVATAGGYQRGAVNVESIADNVPVLNPTTGHSLDVGAINGQVVAVAPRTQVLTGLGDLPLVDCPVHIFTSELSLSVDKTSLSTTLRGREEYATAFNEGRHPEQTYTHTSVELPADYHYVWDDLDVYGCGSGDSDGPPVVSAVTLLPSGVVSTNSISADKLGLRAVDQVGRKTADRLKAAGYTTRDDLAAAEIADLTDVEGIGRNRATKVIESAQAVEHGELVLTGGGVNSLPENDPIYLDIETDGLTPSVVWLIGAYDTRTGEYHDWVAKTPDLPNTAVTGFVHWLADRPQEQPLIAYNGRGFDFPVLHDQIADTHPDKLHTWTSRYRFDPLEWASDHARLPGRTNQLKDVAAGLGWDTDTTGLSGAIVGDLYTEYMRSQADDAELDWDRHRTYCEDDVRSLKHVTEAILTAAEEEDFAGGTDEIEDVETETQQGSLRDW